MEGKLWGGALCQIVEVFELSYSNLYYTSTSMTEAIKRELKLLKDYL